MAAGSAFDWDDANRHHLAAHGVKPEEFEQVFKHRRFETRQQRKNEERVCAWDERIAAAC